MRILLATDGSENADAAVNVLSTFTAGPQRDIILLSVVQLPELHHVMGGREFQAEYVRKRQEELRAGLAKIESVLAPRGARIEQAVRDGHPGKVILEEAQARGVDLVVMGAIGSSLLDRLLLGSTSEFVATHAHTSVLIARPEIPVEGPARVMVPFDASPQSENALLQLTESGCANEMTIDLVYVLSLQTGQGAVADAEAFQEMLREQAQAAMQTLMAKPEFNSLDITPHLLEAAHVGKALCKFATEQACQMVVMGSTGQGLLARFLLGSVSRYMLRHAPCSVWISRRQNDGAAQIDS